MVEVAPVSLCVDSIQDSVNDIDVLADNVVLRD